VQCPTNRWRPIEAIFVVYAQQHIGYQGGSMQESTWDGTLAVEIPLSETAIASVNVPPMSIPMRRLMFSMGPFVFPQFYIVVNLRDFRGRGLM
jgi:hypothetical protein